MRTALWTPVFLLIMIPYAIWELIVPEGTRKP